MTDRVRQQVTDYLAGALDEPEMEKVRALIQTDPAYGHAMRLAAGDLGRLEVLKRDLALPPGLAERTCNRVLDPVQRLRMGKARARAMTPVAPPAPKNRVHWLDVAVAAAIVLIAGLLVLPAINNSRFQARITACQDNLKSVGQALTEYSHRNHEVFPPVPAQGNLAADGIWAPVLKEEGFLAEPQQVLCPEAALTQQGDFSIPSLDQLRKAAGKELTRIQRRMGGSYGYCLGYIDKGEFEPTRNYNRDYFAILADTPSDRTDHQSTNHGGIGQNVLFEDLHIEFCTSTRPGNGRDDIYTNDNHQVAPGLNRDDSVLASSGTAPAIYIGLP